ncbi:MAG: heparinase II/III family protein [Armatimonadota bacterium]
MARYTLPAILMATIVCGVGAMPEELVALSAPRPRLELRAGEIERLRADEGAVRAARAAGDAALAQTRTTVSRDYYVSLPAAEFPPRHTDRWPHWTGLAGELRRRMVDAARAYVLTGERRYLSWCRELMLAVASWPQWTDPCYGSGPNLDTHHLTRGMCVAVDLLWNDLPEQDRTRVVEAIASKGAEFIYEWANQRGSYLSDPSLWPNGYAMINTELGIAGLTLLGAHERAEEWLSRGLRQALRFLEEQGGRDGGLVEGFGYGSAAVDDIIYLLTRVPGCLPLRGTPGYLSEAIYFPAYFVVPGGGSLPSFGDNGGPEGCPPMLLGLAWALAKEGDPTAAWYLHKTGESGPEIDLFARTPELPLARHFRDIDWVAMRSGWGDTGSLLAFKCGRADHHNHLDQNSFTLACNDEWLLNEPGYQIYDVQYPAERNMPREVAAARHEYTYGTLGHNAILVDGRGQEPVRGRIAGFATTPAMDWAVGDASACYPGLRCWLRHVVSVAPDYYAIFDEIATDGPARVVELLLHTTHDGRVAVTGSELPVSASRAASEATIWRTGEAVVRFVVPPQLSIEHRQHPHCERYGHYLAAAVGPLTQSTLAWALACGARGRVTLETRRAEARGATALQVRVAQGVDTIALAAEPSATVGDLAFTGALAMVRDTHAGASRYALMRGTSLRRSVGALVTADAPVSIGAAIDQKRFQASVCCEQDTMVTLHCPVEPDMARVSGIQSPVDVGFDRAHKTVTLELPPGDYRIEVWALQGK